MESPFLYLTTTGRTSGLPREIEIWFVEAGGKYYILAEKFHDAHWVRNIVNNPRVQVRVGDRHFEASARALDPRGDADNWKIAQELERAKYGWCDGLPVEITPLQDPSTTASSAPSQGTAQED
jgi:deazaflavin-dependent oxidoreductase (nitroreductase family)